MMKTLTTTPAYRKKQESSVILEKFIEALTNLDISVFEPYVQEEHVFEDLEKYEFLELMKSRIDRAREEGVKRFTMVESTCHGCQLGHKTYEFHHQNRSRFAFVVLFEKGEVSEIFRCTFSNGKFDYEAENERW
jgi:hypothetical protein